MFRVKIGYNLAVFLSVDERQLRVVHVMLTPLPTLSGVSSKDSRLGPISPCATGMWTPYNLTDGPAHILVLLVIVILAVRCSAEEAMVAGAGPMPRDACAQ